MSGAPEGRERGREGRREGASDGGSEGVREGVREGREETSTHGYTIAHENITVPYSRQYSIVESSTILYSIVQ